MDASASTAELIHAVAHTRSPCRFHVLVEAANFTYLRRYLGCARADVLVQDMVDRLRLTLPEARARAIGRNLVELDVEGDVPEQLETLMASACRGFDEPLDLDGEPHRVKIVIAGAVGGWHTDEVTLAEEAERALAKAREYDKPVTQAIEALPHDAKKLAEELDLAIDRGELVLFYQPKVHARRQEITSAEALIRWQHPTRGLILPGDFIPVAEQAQLIRRLTLWTIEQAIADSAKLHNAGHDLRLFVNISGQLLSDDLFVANACRMVAGSDAALGFEVTETSVIRDPESAIANLQRFADIGIRVAIDDYGAGLSSLAYLKQLPARELKIDKLFVTQLTSSNRDPLIVRSTIDLAHALDMEVVAEGVETHAALALLTVMGCDMIQGFLISRPIAFDAFVTFLREDRHRRAPEVTRDSFNRLAATWKRG
ncbi:EAL domain, c-di-GMP-specific phosphodiesterase class I (or its enzymatically inactive variant) [Sphingomonas palmae]|uniref:EAL domain, c-di-GMP-specific phosphodiesterase class I (Or its enzymatically inactive variant) n=1 Tax=Sphingomonas palmae TaxID=1855283 RepID=A0A1H7HZF9_9SPHN|nr:EAL domain-containing protein [Sphingomonas palmae]SEK54530.1 EAL domain, c-di-GMP-specific phosphodiesterase class I (or its enzymatically inactive variant) [Sphingomonas palmae]